MDAYGLFAVVFGGVILHCRPAHARASTKRIYHTRVEAEQAALDWANAGVTVHAYKCPHCCGFHVTKQPQFKEVWNSSLSNSQARTS